MVYGESDRLVPQEGWQEIHEGAKAKFPCTTVTNPPQRAGPPGTAFAKTSVYERKASLRVISILAVSVASLAPIISIVVLSALKDSNKLRLGLMSLFTVLFCILCSLFTGAKKTELLAASAA